MTTLPTNKKKSAKYIKISHIIKSCIRYDQLRNISEMVIDFSRSEDRDIMLVYLKKELELIKGIY